MIINAMDSIAEKQTQIADYKGEITVTVSTDTISEDYTNIEIADNGIGISDFIQPRIFNPYYTTKQPEHGQGLGLYIIKNILLKYGGTIRLNTKFKEGAKFTVQIPKKAKK